MKVEVEIRDAELSLTADKAMESAIAATAEQALKDCNYYCKQDMDSLIKSSLIHSDINGGVLKWVTPYAEFQYTFPGTRKDKNPNASPEWCGKAETNHKDRWEQIFANAHRKEMNK